MSGSHAPSTLPERLGFHARLVGSLEADLAAERAAFHEALTDTLLARQDDGTPMWCHDDIAAVVALLSTRGALESSYPEEGGSLCDS